MDDGTDDSPDARAVATALPNETSLSRGTHVAVYWAQIAIAHAHGARRARQALADAQRRGSPLEFALGTELHASLIAISAAANALEALFTELKPLVFTGDIVNSWKRSRTKRRQQIRETFKHGFRLVGDQWAKDFDWLLDLRNDAVRPRFAAGDPHVGSHPLGIGAAPEFSEFTCEQAERAARLIVGVYVTCTAYPWPATRDWAKEMAPMIAELQADLDGALG